MNRCSPLYEAIREDGIDNFCCSAIETDVENADERELYWIDFFNSRVPNGYNVDADFKHNAAFKTHDQVQRIKSMIKSGKRFKVIADQCGVSEKTVSAINRGVNYYDPSEQYPLRIKDNWSRDKLKQLHYSLKYELDKTTHAIAKEYDIPLRLVNAVNKGERDQLPGNTYPLRAIECGPNLTDDQVKQAQDLLLHSDLTIEQIAREVDTNANAIQRVNTGDTHRNNKLSYPLRQSVTRNARTCLSPEEIRQIETYLREEDKSMRDIGALYSISETTIMNINSGRIKKYYNDDVTYPIRKHR